MHSNARDILPQTISPLTFTVWWILLFFTILAGLLVWLIPIPYDGSAPGMVLNQPTAAHATPSAQLLIFFPENTLPLLHQDQAIQIRLGSHGPQLSGYLDRLTARSLSPRERGTSSAHCANPLPAFPPATLVGIVRLDHPGVVQRYSGSSVQIHYQQGTQPVLAFLLYGSSSVQTS
jgi:hypothetical protein